MTFLPTVDGGRTVPPFLNGRGYRPGVREVNATSETTFGVGFDSGPVTFSLGDTVEATFLVIAWPDPSCHWLDVGAEFDICEGGIKVGSGVVASAWVQDD